MQVASVSVSLLVLLGSDCYLQRPSTDCDVELIILLRVWVPSFTEDWDWNIGQPLWKEGYGCSSRWLTWDPVLRNSYCMSSPPTAIFLCDRSKSNHWSPFSMMPIDFSFIRVLYYHTWSRVAFVSNSHCHLWTPTLWPVRGPRQW